MPVYKDEKRGTWFCQFYFEDWRGQCKKKRKRGFHTKREALEFERQFKYQSEASMDMKLKDFVELYFNDKKGELKERSIKNKRHMIGKHIIPDFGEIPMNKITPGDIIQWQNSMREKGYEPTYLRMIQNQLSALFNHAYRIYKLYDNPCSRVKKMGKSDANKMDFWTKEEYETFLKAVNKKSYYWMLFEVLFWTGCRVGDADGKISLNQQKPSKHAGLRRFGPEKFLQRNNEFMKERPIFYKKPIKTEKDFSTWLRCFYYTTKAVITEYIYF